MKSSVLAKLFGGGTHVAGLNDLGARNADFAEQYVKREGCELELFGAKP